MFKFAIITYRQIRKLFFTKPRPEGMYLVVDASPEHIYDVLGRNYYAPNWETSYNYRGESINLSQVFYETHPRYSIKWWQNHVRGWKRHDGLLELSSHFEPEPTEYPREHLDGVGLEDRRAMDDLEDMLIKSDIEVVGEKYHENK